MQRPPRHRRARLHAFRDLHHWSCVSELIFDYIVYGAGTSGCVVAARLAADLRTQVLLLEAGGTDETDLITNPNRWPMTLAANWIGASTAEPNPHLNGRAIPYSMGKVLGGGSSINVSTWSRGHRADWDFYASESGDPSWGYEAVLDLYRHRIEAWAGSPDPDYRGMRGMVHVQPAAEPHHSPSLACRPATHYHSVILAHFTTHRSSGT
jgi:choline dehydrogenase